MGWVEGATAVVVPAFRGMRFKSSLTLEWPFLSGRCPRYPFLVPNLIGSFGALLLLPIVMIYVPETKDFDEQRARGELRR